MDDISISCIESGINADNLLELRSDRLLLDDDVFDVSAPLLLLSLVIRCESEAVGSAYSGDNDDDDDREDNIRVDGRSSCFRPSVRLMEVAGENADVMWLSL